MLLAAHPEWHGHAPRRRGPPRLQRRRRVAGLAGTVTRRPRFAPISRRTSRRRATSGSVSMMPPRPSAPEPSWAVGARLAFAPADLGRAFALAEVELYGDVVLCFVTYPRTGRGPVEEDIEATPQARADTRLPRRRPSCPRTEETTVPVRCSPSRPLPSCASCSPVRRAPPSCANCSPPVDQDDAPSALAASCSPDSCNG